MTAIVHLWGDSSVKSSVRCHKIGAEINLTDDNAVLVIYAHTPKVKKELAAELEKAAEQLRKSVAKESVAFEKAS